MTVHIGIYGQDKAFRYPSGSFIIGCEEENWFLQIINSQIPPARERSISLDGAVVRQSARGVSIYSTSISLSPHLSGLPSCSRYTSHIFQEPEGCNAT